MHFVPFPANIYALRTFDNNNAAGLKLLCERSEGAQMFVTPNLPAL